MISSSKAAIRALSQRRSKELVRKPIILHPDFLKQNAFIEDDARYIVAQCSRRAGKTTGLGVRFLRTLERYPKSQCVYLALTRDSARDIMWPVLHDLNDTFGLGLSFIESRLTAIHPNGARLILLGADMSNFIKRLKGRKYPGAAIDESQDFGPHLESLLNDVLTPSIADYADGWLALCGTPGPVPSGYYFQITQEKRFGYSFHEWTLLDNPYMPEPEKFIADLKLKREWDDNNPTLLREWRNRWVLDVHALWVRYSESVNDFDTLPIITPDKWIYILGIDLGFKDADALAVLAWSEACDTTFLVEELITAKQGITELVTQIQDMQKKYDISKMVIDEGGLGKKIAEEIRRQKGIPVAQADKALKQQNVSFLNDSLRTGRFKARKNSRFVQDSYLVQIDWDKSRPDKIIIKKTPHSDIIDAVLYAYKESPAYSYQAKIVEPKWGTKDWVDKQQSEMWENALAHHEAEAEIFNRLNGEY